MSYRNNWKSFTDYVLAFTSLVIIFGSFSNAALAQDSDDAVITKFIAKQASRENGGEYEPARKTIAGDLNKDRTPDLAVLYTIEGQNGTNNYIQYLAVFARVKGRLVAVTKATVGGKMIRAVDLISIRKGQILLDTLNYAPLDATCCPSIKGKTRYVLVNRKLKQL